VRAAEYSCVSAGPEGSFSSWVDYSPLSSKGFPQDHELGHSLEQEEPRFRLAALQNRNLPEKESRHGTYGGVPPLAAK
jgi:hypothetical protein